ncbi:MAG: hypothetical protein KAJ18_03400 [Candidatus Omnitrophica bacterium]|nr:hypothetical protein [Candidatus Omnitrophota bacterium]
MFQGGKNIIVYLFVIVLTFGPGLPFGYTQSYPDEVEMALDDYEGIATQEYVPGYSAEVDEVASDESGGAGDIDDAAVIDLLELRNMDIVDVLKLISQKSGLNIIAGKGVSGRITIYLKDVKLKDALRIILDANNLAYKVEYGIVRVMPAQEFETRYGHVFGGEIKTRIVRLMYGDTKEMESVLSQMKSSKGKIISDSKSNTLVLMDSLDKLEIMQMMIREMDSPVETRIFELSYARAEDIMGNIEENLTPGAGQARQDERSNKIIVTDTPSKIQEISRMVRAFDTKEKQVLIKAKIIQVVLSDQHKFGIDWQAIVRDYKGLDMASNFDILSSSDKSGILSIGTIASDDYTFLVEALETEGRTNILSSPSITSLNNKEAKILVGSTEPYVTTTTTTPSSGPTTTAESINFIDVGVKLYVTPTIHKDGFITMKIKPEVSSVTQTITTSNNNTIPVVETSEAETTVMVKDGVTIVIGGLIKEERIATENKVPLLGDIPLLRYAFRNDDELMRKTEIVIFLTPKIISGDVPSKSLL